jgi:tetratricopeptide (TPR) repeat protein
VTESLFERYKDALKRGHLAAQKGRVEEAITAYREAGVMAPDRALPHGAIGHVLRRAKRLDEAHAAYTTGIARSADDEAAWRSRAELQEARGRLTDAADDYASLAGVLERGGKLTEASDAARRALELAESRSRRREVERLGALLREQGDADDTVEAMDEALRLKAVDAPPDVLAAAAKAAEPPPPDPAVLRAVADALLDDGDIPGAAERLLTLAALHRQAGRLDAAMDACLTLVAATPADPALQLEIALIQLERGWTQVAGDKLGLLARIAELDGNPVAATAITALAAERGLDPTPRAVPPS